MSFSIKVVCKRDSSMSKEEFIRFPSLAYQRNKDANTTTAFDGKIEQLPIYAENVLNKIANQKLVFHYGSYTTLYNNKTIEKPKKKKVNQINDSTCCSASKERAKQMMHKIPTLPLIFKPIKLPSLNIKHYKKKSLHEIALYYERIESNKIL